MAVSPPDSITVPDGKPLTLQLVSSVTSATAKVGDIVEFKVPHSLRIDGLVVVPRGTIVSGTVVLVTHPHRPTKKGSVGMAIEKVVLPSGEVLPLRPSRSASGKPQGMAAEHEKGDPGLWLLMAPLDPLGWVVAPAMLFTKGHEAVYPADTQTTVYFNGPLILDRAALLKSQPPPYKRPAQVLFNNVSGRAHLFSPDAPEVFFADVGAPDSRSCGRVGPVDLGTPLRLELNPGTYSFTVDTHDRIIHGKAQPVQIELRDDHQYWIQRESRALSMKDIQQNATEFEMVQDTKGLFDRDFTVLPPQDSCPQAAHP